MRIALRTSGGRGEYELAGSQGDKVVADLIEREIIVELVPRIEIRTGNIPLRVQGKPRIRLKDSQLYKHAYLIITDALLLPKPKREIGVTSKGPIQIIDNDYSVTTIQFDIVDINQTEVIIRPTDLVLSNSSDSSARINIIERMRTILDLWSQTSTTANQFTFLLTRHQDAFKRGNIGDLSRIAQEIRRQIINDQDPLNHILNTYGFTDRIGFPTGIEYDQIETAIRENDEVDPAEARIERIREWRLQALRGVKGRKFRNLVTQAYNFTCLFSGYYLPKTSHTGSAGVDAAHILPWADYDLTSVTNGLCLNKLCHWAFDSGIIRLDYDKTKSIYVISIPSKILAAEANRMIDLTAFHPMKGPIPSHRLPRNKSLWPNPQYLELFNQEFEN